MKSWLRSVNESIKPSFMPGGAQEEAKPQELLLGIFLRRESRTALFHLWGVESPAPAVATLFHDAEVFSTSVAEDLLQVAWQEC